MKILYFISLVLFFAFLQFAQALPVPQDTSDIVWWHWDFDIRHLYFSPNDSLILTNSEGKIHLWETATGTFIESKQYDSIKGGKFTYDGRFIIGFFNYELIKIELNKWQNVVNLEISPFIISDFDFSPDGNKIYACFDNCIGYGVWDINTGILIDIVKIDTARQYHTSRTYNIGVSYNENSIVLSGAKTNWTGNKENTTFYDFIIDNNSKNVLKEIKDAWYLYLSKDRTKYASLFRDNNNGIRIYDFQTGNQVNSIPSSYLAVSDIAFSPNGNYLAYSGGNMINIIDLTLKQTVYKYDYQSSFNPLAVSNDNKYITSGVGPALFLLKAYWNKTSVEDSNNIAATICYPNPADEIIQLNFSLLIPNQTIINISDLQGKIMKPIENKYFLEGNYSYNINLQSLSSGIYYIIIKSGDDFFSQKIIINH